MRTFILSVLCFLVILVPGIAEARETSLMRLRAEQIETMSNTTARERVLIRLLLRKLAAQDEIPKRRRVQRRPTERIEQPTSGRTRRVTRRQSSEDTGVVGTPTSLSKKGQTLAIRQQAAERTAQQRAQARTALRIKQAQAQKSQKSLIEQVFELVNKERAKHRLHPLVGNSHLFVAATRHAADMYKRGYFGHDTPEGTWPKDRIRKAGYSSAKSTVYGENIARGQTSATKVVRDWMNSHGHRTNILSHNFNETGIAKIGNVWVQTFGGRR